MPDLVALAMPGGPAFVDALRRVWDDGDTAFPVDLRLPADAQQTVVRVMAPSRLIDAGGEAVALDGGRPTEPGDALVVATSGTTGEPKGVVLTHDAVTASALATSRRVEADLGRDRWLACLPLAHVGGLSVVTRAILTGTALTVHATFEPDAVTRAAAEGATLVSLVPTALARIDPSVFRVIVLGGAAPPAVVPPNVMTTYGLTETGSGVVYDGVALEGVEVDVGADGIVRLRGPMLLRAYRDGIDPKDRDGWFSTGDVGALDDAGRLTVIGRRGDMIVTGGENVWPEPVERVLATHPGVSEVAVVGRPDAEWGQRVVAYAVPRDHARPPTLADLRALAKASMPSWCAPRELVLVKSLPRTNLGKIRRHDL